MSSAVRPLDAGGRPEPAQSPSHGVARGDPCPATGAPAPPLVTDEQWALIAPLVPARQRSDPGWRGRPACDDRAALNGILLVLHTGIGWARLPSRSGYGSGWTCWRRWRDWQERGAWERIYALTGHTGAPPRGGRRAHLCLPGGCAAVPPADGSAPPTGAAGS